MNQEEATPVTASDSRAGAGADAVRLSTRRWKPCAPTVGRDEHMPLLKRVVLTTLLS
jgi:hypothetical protein